MTTKIPLDRAQPIADAAVLAGLAQLTTTEVFVGVSAT
jgi:hypothetical protein